MAHFALKLSEGDVEDILRAPQDVGTAALAERYGVSTVQINRIRSGRSFRALRIARAQSIPMPNVQPPPADKALRRLINQILGAV